MIHPAHALLVLLAITLSAGNAGAHSRPAPGGCGENELFVSLTSDDTWRASMAFIDRRDR